MANEPKQKRPRSPSVPKHIKAVQACAAVGFDDFEAFIRELQERTPRFYQNLKDALKGQ